MERVVVPSGFEQELHSSNPLPKLDWPERTNTATATCGLAAPTNGGPSVRPFTELRNGDFGDILGCLRQALHSGDAHAGDAGWKRESKEFNPFTWCVIQVRLRPRKHGAHWSLLASLTSAPDVAATSLF